MKCGHCGAGNSDSAKFCGKCAVRLRANSTSTPTLRAQSAATTVASPREIDIETIIQLDYPDDVVATPAVAPKIPVSSSVDQDMASAIDQLDQAKMRRKKRSVVIAVVSAAVVIAAAGGAWLARDSKVGPTSATKVAVTDAEALKTRATSAPTSNTVAPIAISTATPSNVSGSALASAAGLPVDTVTPALVNGTKVQADKVADKDEKPKDARPAPVKRKAESSGARKTEKTPVAPDEQNKVRDAVGRGSQDDATKTAKPRPQQQALLQSPQQACADRSNFISRGICESRECERPERANLKFCIDMKARRAPREYAN